MDMNVASAPTSPADVRRDVIGARSLAREPIRVAPAIAATVAAGLAVTLLVTATDVLSFAYHSTSLHVAVETAAALASIVAAQSVYGRFRSSLQLRDLVLVAALGMFASANVLFAAIPAVASGQPGAFRTWAPVLGQLVATALLAAAAFLPLRVVHRPRLAAARALVACELTVGGIALLVVALHDALPVAIPPASMPAHGPRVVGDPVVLGAQLLSVALFAAAAIGFGLRAARTGDTLVRWVAVAATLGGFARLNYFLFPSLYTPWFYAGDGLRLACFLALFAGGVQETRRLQRALAAAAVLEERRRIARELHDGVTQDLAYLVQQLRHIAGRPEGAGDVEPLVRAAEGALDGSRDAISALTRPTDAPLDEAVATTAREAAEREGCTVELDVARGIQVPPRTQHELLRVVREAVINGIRHGGARRIRVEIREDPRLRIVIIDDGLGFDPDAARAAGRLGLESMAARVQAIGGELSITSSPDRGTEVGVTLP